MSFVAEASLESKESPDVLYDRLADHQQWFRFMPRSFKPLGQPRPTLKVGDRLRVRVGGLASPIFLSTMNRPQEIAWTGGRRGVLYAEHRFVFEASGTGTRVRSIETWEGALSGLLRPILQRLAERVGKQQLRGLVGAG